MSKLAVDQNFIPSNRTEQTASTKASYGRQQGVGAS